MLRRQLLAALCLAACDRERGHSAATTTASVSQSLDGWEELHFPRSEHYDEPEMAAVLLQRDAPLLVAFHGRGEAGRGLEAGARGWRDDYALGKAHLRLAKPPLTPEDFLGFVRSERLAALNASLAAMPYRGIAVACPYCPALADRTVKGSQPFARFVIGDLIPKVRRRLGSDGGPQRVGIDGVSMGGRLALLIGLTHPNVFQSVGALQPAIAVREAGWLADLAAKAAPLALRLVSSDDDPFLQAVLAFSKALDERAVKHEVVVTPGPHDYTWNRGPGAYELLVWHERILRGLTAP